MPRIGLRLLGLLAIAAAASSALAAGGIHWQQDIEAAKATAKHSDRLVLVHVWSDSCVPCKALDNNVFNQPGVAAAIEAQYVPVKLNANEYPATAQGFGITRVPTDVILTPDGTVIGKMISPATPSAYLAEMSQAASRHHTQSGRAYQMAAAAAPQPPVLNSAYSDLAIGAPPLPELPTATAPTPPVANNGPYLPAQSGSTALAPPPANMSTPNPYLAAAASTPPAAVPNTYSADRHATTPPVNAPPVATPPTQAANPYMAYGGPAAPAAAQPITPSYYSPPQPPVTPPVTGYDMEPARPAAVAPPDMSIPPANAGGIPVSEEAKRTESTPPSQTTASTTTSGSQQLPPGAPPLGFDGYCPVSMRTAWKWVPGDAKFGAIHRGRTYLFIGPEEQKQFLANPDYYSPALAGVDPVLAIDHKQNVPGLRDHSLDYDNQFFLFSSEATLQQFTANPERYASGVRQAMGIQPGQQTR